MGTSARGILLSGIYCMLGFYNFSFNANEEASRKAAVTVVATAKAERLSSTATSLGLSFLRDVFKEKYPPTSKKELKKLGSIDVGYEVKRYGTVAYVTSTVTTDDLEITTVTKTEFKAKRWYEMPRWHVIDTQTQTKSALKKTKK